MPEALAPLTRRSSYRWAAILVLAAAGACAVLFIASRRRTDRWPGPVSVANAVGDSTCLSCHGDKAAFEGTAHHLTTRRPTRESIAGSFRSGANVLRTPNAGVHFRMDADSTGFHQTAIVGTGPDTSSRTERIALVVGSGRKGQSYLYWVGDRLYQLPVSYWRSVGQWINSPGPAYVDGRPNFERAVAPRCLECHATWIESVPDLGVVNRYHPEGAILGITCERCHAAGREHVTRERSMLHAARAPAIVNPARLTRERQMEACGQCHAGLGAPKAPAFSYVAGRRLDDYLELASRPSDATVDVHGNQVALLSRSRCYRSSQMTCLTCHDVHRQQRDVADLSGRCLGCHQERSCGLFATEGHRLAGRCVDCHMPLQASNLIVSALDGKQERALVRTHWIRVYPTAPEPATRGDGGVNAGRSTWPPGLRWPAPPGAAPR
jgi:hypothetical protein